MKPFQRIQHGVTLIELIVVMVVTGIIATVLANFMIAPIRSYMDTIGRADLTDVADVSLRRLARDVRLALPNSLRLKNSANAEVADCASGTECYIEFILTKSGGRYRDESDGSTCNAASQPFCLSFTDTTRKRFDILGSSPSNPPNISNGDHVVVYNLGADYAPADAYSGGNRTTVTLTSGTPYYLTLNSNVFAAQNPPLPSPGARFQIVDQNDQVVRYGCGTDGVLTRYWGCSFGSTSTCARSAVLAGNSSTQASCTLEYSKQNATGNSGTLYIRLTLTKTSSGESASLFQQIHVNNAP